MNTHHSPQDERASKATLLRHLAFGILLFIASSAHAQWQTTNYSLKGGWNSIYLHGSADYATLDTLMAATDALPITEVWRWNPNPNQVQFTTSPLIPTAGTPEWSVWVRGGGANTLNALTGPAAYLVKCTGTTSNSYTTAIKQSALPPSSTWVRNGANLLGFPTKLGSNYPLFSSYFATFPAAIAANTRIYKYVGGDLGAANPVQVFSPSTERVDRNQAYWFDSEVVGNFYAPMEISLSLATGMDFGRTGSLVTARLQNRTNAAVTVTITPVVSNAAPSGQETLTGGINNVGLPTGNVPITRRTFNSSTGVFDETLIQVAYSEVVGPLSSVELSFGINRAAMTGASNALYASILQFADTGNLFDIKMPVRARKTSLAGLWIGEASVNAVESKPAADAVTATARSYPLRYIIHVADDGTARVLSQVCMGKLAPSPFDFGLCTKEAGLKATDKATATRIVAAHLPLDRVLDGVADAAEPAGSGSVAVPGTLTRVISIPFNDPTNPFVHQYHPDHDNKSPTGAALVAGQESYSVKRTVTFTFTATPPVGSNVTSGWGSAVIGGTYAEVIDGLHKDSAGVGTGNGLNIAGTFELRRVSELGSISVNP